MEENTMYPDQTDLWQFFNGTKRLEKFHTEQNIYFIDSKVKL